MEIQFLMCRTRLHLRLRSTVELPLKRVNENICNACNESHRYEQITSSLCIMSGPLQPDNGFYRGFMWTISENLVMRCQNVVVVVETAVTGAFDGLAQY